MSQTLKDEFISFEIDYFTFLRESQWFINTSTLNLGSISRKRSVLQIIGAKFIRDRIQNRS